MNKQLTLEIDENFYQFDLIKKRFEKWNANFKETYKNAYVGHSLPKLFTPLIRCEIIDWNPLEKVFNFIQQSFKFN